jgi:hypothetical protein
MGVKKARAILCLKMKVNTFIQFHYTSSSYFGFYGTLETLCIDVFQLSLVFNIGNILESWCGYFNHKFK